MHFLFDSFILITLIFFNSFFVSAEISIIASRESKLNAASNKSKGAKKALLLISRPEDFLSSVQIGITLINVVIGSYGGASISSEISELLKEVPYISQYREQISYIIVILVITYFTVLGEVIPKRIAMMYPEKIASFTSYAMVLFTKIMYPVVKSLGFLTRIVINSLKLKEKKNKISIEELRLMLNQAEFSGMLATTEHDILRRIIHLSSAQIGAVMTPRNKMIWIDIQDKDKDNISKIKKHPFNHFPVVDGGLNNVIGVIEVKSLLLGESSNKKITSTAKKFHIIYIPETARVSVLIDLFREKKVRIALVVDEYGEIEGLITLNDILKILIGDLAIGMEEKIPDIITNKDGSYMVSATTLIDEVMSLLDLSSLPGDEEEDYRTLAGFILSQTKNFPKAGDEIQSMGWSFKIIKMDKRRIERVLIKKI